MASVTIDDEVYQSYVAEARKHERAVDEFVNEVLVDWLTEYQDDIAVANERVSSYDQTGDGVDIEHVLRERGITY